MKVEKLSVSLPITNHDEFGDNYNKHGPLFGGCSKRALIVGASGCGKTTVLITLLEHPNGLRFENVYLYSKSLHQPKYEYLRKLLKPINEIGYFEYNHGEDVVLPQDIRCNSVIIFDDVVCCNQDIIRQHFSFGRHKNLSLIHI